MGREALVTEMIRQLESNRTDVVSLKMLNTIMTDPKYRNDFLALRMDELAYLGINPFTFRYIDPIFRPINNFTQLVITPPLTIFKNIKSIGNKSMNYVLGRPQPVIEEPIPYKLRTKEVIFDDIISRIETQSENPEFFMGYKVFIFRLSWIKSLLEVPFYICRSSIYSLLFYVFHGFSIYNRNC